MKSSIFCKIPFSNITLIFALLALGATGALAQPTFCVDTNTTKWIQAPQTQQGLDVRDSRRVALADDFLCTSKGPITDIHIWGSWLNEQPGTITNFWIGIYNDVPVQPGVNPFSHPGTNLLWSQDFPLGVYALSPYTNGNEYFFDPSITNIIGGDQTVWYYCFYPTNPFIQQGSANNPTNYWLAIVAQVADPNTNIIYGWKTTYQHYHDAAVWIPASGGKPLATGVWSPMFDPINQTNVDLAFKLATTNTPTVPCVETNGVKYIQPPNLEGLDVWNNGPWMLADDFVCTKSGPISDIHIWGSWLSDLVDSNSLTFTLGIYDDVPVNPTNSFSHPGNLLWQQTFVPGQYAENFFASGAETFLDPGPPNPIGTDSQAWFYCFYPTNPFVQGGTAANPSNYWLAVYAQLPAGTAGYQYGWKTTFVVSNDTSVHAPWPGSLPTNNPGWLPTLQSSTGGPLDLSFILTTPTNNCIIPIACALDKTVECGSSWTYDPPTVGPSSCCPNPTVIFSAVTNSGPCTQTNTGTWVILDCLGNPVGNCTQNVTVVDTNPPIFSGCVASKTVQCGSGWVFDTPTASYVCSGSNAPVGIVSMTTTNLNACTNIQTETWAATNACSGSIATCTEVVTVVDTTPPAITCPSNIVAYTCGTNAVVTWSITATDACSSVTITSTPPSGTVFLLNTTNTVLVTASDACGNTATCSFTVTVLRAVDCVQCVESDFEKYVQGPNILGGFDVWNNPYVLADDFVCTNSGPISDIHLWGSWLNDQAVTNSITFWLGIYDDVPTNVSNPFSHPGTNLLWQQWFTPGQYAETIWTANAQEQFLDPGLTNIIGGDSVVWYYCFYPTNAFQQLGTPTNSKTYWLAAYAQPSLYAQTNGFLYGWKSTTNVLHDASVHAFWPGSAPTNNPGWTPTVHPPPPVGGPAVPLDLAFKLTMCGPVRIHWLPPTNVVVTWQGGGYLQSATNVTGPYIDVPGFPPSPYTDYSVTPTNKFYRLRCY